MKRILFVFIKLFLITPIVLVGLVWLSKELNTRGYSTIPLWAGLIVLPTLFYAIKKTFNFFKFILFFTVITPMLYSGFEFLAKKYQIPLDFKMIWAFRGVAVTFASFLYMYAFLLIKKIFILMTQPFVYINKWAYSKIKNMFFKFRKIPTCPINKSLSEIDKFGNGDTYEKGRIFEEFIAQMYRAIGYDAKTTTQLRKEGKLPPSIQSRGGSGEQGVDVIYNILTEEGSKKVLIQCKHYSQKVSNQAIQEIVGAMKLYKGDHAVVITNNYFTKPAIELALANGVTLIDRDRLKDVIAKATKIYYNNYESYKNQKEEITLPEDLAA